MIIKSPIAFHILGLLYYTMTKMVVANEVITTTLPDFVEKVLRTENKYLQSHTINMINELEPLQLLYLIVHNITSIILIIRFL